VKRVVTVCEVFASKQRNKIDRIFISCKLKFWLKRYIPVSPFFLKKLGIRKIINAYSSYCFIIYF